MIGQVIVRFRRALQRHLHELPQAPRKRRREHARADDDAGVAVARQLARAAAVDERDGEPALRELQRRGRADDAGAENEYVGAMGNDVFLQ